MLIYVQTPVSGLALPSWMPAAPLAPAFRGLDATTAAAPCGGQRTVGAHSQGARGGATPTTRSWSRARGHSNIGVSRGRGSAVWLPGIPPPPPRTCTSASCCCNTPAYPGTHSAFPGPLTWVPRCSTSPVPTSRSAPVWRVSTCGGCGRRGRGLGQRRSLQHQLHPGDRLSQAWVACRPAARSTLLSHRLPLP